MKYAPPHPLYIHILCGLKYAQHNVVPARRDPTKGSARPFEQLPLPGLKTWGIQYFNGFQ